MIPLPINCNDNSNQQNCEGNKLIQTRNKNQVVIVVGSIQNANYKHRKRNGPDNFRFLIVKTQTKEQLKP